MKKAYVFPGQGAQFAGMGKELYNSNETCKKMFAIADKVLGFDISNIMMEGSIEDLTRTEVTQPAVYIHSVLSTKNVLNFKPDMVAGHSLGEFSALTAIGSLSFEDGLSLVSVRAKAMQKACELTPSTMAAVLGLEDDIVDTICQNISEEIVVAANYNCPGQLVISGSIKGIELASEKLKEAGAKRVLPLKVGGAFHSPLMSPAQKELQSEIENTHFQSPMCPIYQNVSTKSTMNIEEIKMNLIAQLTGSVQWTKSIQQMIKDGATEFYEIGPGAALTGMIKKINADVITEKI